MKQAYVRNPKPKSRIKKNEGRTLFRAPGEIKVESSAGSEGSAHRVVKALENPRFRWRTVKGIARETGIDLGTVQRVLEHLGDGVVRASVTSPSGESLFTTRRAHRKSESIISRFGAVLRNRAA